MAGEMGRPMKGRKKALFPLFFSAMRGRRKKRGDKKGDKLFFCEGVISARLRGPNAQSDKKEVKLMHLVQKLEGSGGRHEAKKGGRTGKVMGRKLISQPRAQPLEERRGREEEKRRRNEGNKKTFWEREERGGRKWGNSAERTTAFSISLFRGMERGNARWPV